MQIGRRGILAGTAALAALPARAQGWPTRSVRLMVAYPAGGSTDIVARLLAERLARAWGQPVVVENRAGAAGVIGADVIAKSPPDGHALLLGASSEIAIAPATQRNMPFDPAKDLTAATLVTQQPFLLLCNPGLPARSIAELVSLAKARPDGINFGSFGNGTSTHLMGELLRVSSGAEMTHVPYRGSAPALTDLMAGQIQFCFDTIPAALPHVQEGRLRALALCHPRHLPSVPGVPTVAEQGFPDLVGGTWAALFAPAGTPEAVLARIQQDTAAALRDGLAQQLRDRGLEPEGNTVAEARAFVAAETAKWAAIVRRANYRPE